jgi:hypothetical protein
MKIEIPLPQLRLVTMEVLEAMRVMPGLRALESHQLLIVQAYMLGISMAALGMQSGTMEALAHVVEKGYQDGATILRAEGAE